MAFSIAAALCASAQPRPVRQAASAAFSYQRMLHYGAVPQSVRAFLDSLDGGTFLIADPGESWQAGCTAFAGEPQRQFISASLAKGRFVMRYWQGGWAKYRQVFSAQIVKGKVVWYRFGT